MTKWEIIFVGEGDDVSGFRLGGLKNVKVINKENASQVLEKLIEFKGLIFLTKKASDLLGEKKTLLESPERIIHTIAGKEGEEYTTIDKIVKETIGFDLKKKRHGKNN